MEDSSGKAAESFLLSERFKFKRLNFSFRARRNILDAQLVDTNFRNLSYFLYYANKNINSIDQIKSSFFLKTQEYFKVLNKDVAVVNSLIKEVDLKLNSKFNKVKVYNIFQEKESEESYDLMDPKRNFRLLKREQAAFKGGHIECQKINESELDIISIELVDEESYFSDTLTPIEISTDTSLIYRKNKFWQYIISAKQSLLDLQVLPHKNPSLSFVINFDGYEEINNIFIEFGSSLPIIFDRNKLFYHDKQTTSWKQLDAEDISVSNNQNQYTIVLAKTIRTNKIKFKLLQKKFHDTSMVHDDGVEQKKINSLFNNSYLNYSVAPAEKEIKRVYDFSILNLSCSRIYNSHRGYYRESYPVVLNNPLSLQIQPDFVFESANCFIEKYAHIVLYGESDFTAHKKQSENYTDTKRVNIQLPIPNQTYKETELLIFKNKIAVMNFFPEIKRHPTKALKDVISIFETDPYGEEDNLPITIGSDCEVSLDGGSTYLSDPNALLSSLIYDSHIYKFWIRLTAPKNNRIYTAEYLLADKIECGHKTRLLLEQGAVTFNTELQGSVGFVRPVFIIRNKSSINQSSKINSYKVLVEEFAENNDAYIDYETFVELERRGTSNVV